MKSFTFVVLLLALWGCNDPNRIYEKNYDFEDNLWLAEDIPEFEFEITDPNKPYRFYYNIRNSINYPFHNLYLRYNLEDSLGNALSTELLNIDLFDPTTGKPYGNGLGDIFDHQVLALPEYSFDQAGYYRFKIEQYMRLDSLPLILSVGLRVEEIPDQEVDGAK